MNLTKWEPTAAFRNFDDFTGELQKLMSWRPRFNGEEALTVADWAPAVDIQETDKEYLVKVEIPEVKKEDVRVLVEEGVLTISGERRKEVEQKGEKFHRAERSYGSFLRTFTMPIDAEENKVNADFRNGMLYVHLMKTEKAKPKSIEVKVS